MAKKFRVVDVWWGVLEFSTIVEAEDEIEAIMIERDEMGKLRQWEAMKYSDTYAEEVKDESGDH